MTFEIKFKNIIVYGKSGEGKSIILNLLADGYTRIYSNIRLYKERLRKIDGKFKKESVLISKIIKKSSDFNNIVYHKTPGLIIVDESGINASSRESMSTKNRILSKILFLGRKTNCYIVWLTQRLKSIDINQRELANLILEMHKIYREGVPHPLFVAQKVRLQGNKKIYMNKWTLDIISYMNYTGRSYDTLESSILT